MALLEANARTGIYFCTDQGYCSRANINLKVKIDLLVDGRYNYTMDTPEKQNVYQEMLEKGEVVLKESASGWHAELTEKGWRRRLSEKPAV